MVMIDPDSQMVRTAEPGWINLAIGEPIFLQAHMDFKLPPEQYRNAGHYPAHGGERDLLECLQEHTGKHVVITNGAKQAIGAALYAYQQMGYRRLCHNAPRWPSYPTLANLSGFVFNGDFLLTEESIYATSSPNNPNGLEEQDPRLVFDIWDAAYAHGVYGWSGIEPTHKVSVWSAAKLFGLSGDRIGWALTNDSYMAKLMGDYVEKSTSGVNIWAQKRLADILGSHKNNPNHLAYKLARKDLLANAASFTYHISPHCDVVHGTPATGKGMFAWFKSKDEKSFRTALQRAKVLVVDGEACGASGDGWFRLSLGQTPAVNEEALARLSQELYYG